MPGECCSLTEPITISTLATFRTLPVSEQTRSRWDKR